MDIERFAKELPALFDDWQLESVRPKSRNLDHVISRVRGMTTVNVLNLLNLAVGYLEAEECYLEVGCFHGATLIGALLGHPGCIAYAVDNFSEFDPHDTNAATLLQNVASFQLDPQVRFYRQDFELLLRQMREQPVQVGVYLYDGAHDYRSQLLGLLLAVPLLAPRALIVVDDGNCPAVKQATWDFLALRPDAQMLFDLPTPRNCHCSFWNGLHVLGWEAGSNNQYDSYVFSQARQTPFLNSLDMLQRVNLDSDGKEIWLTAAT